MTQLSQNILGKIKQEHLAPVPRWHFLIKSYAYWALLGLSIILGSLSFSVIVHIFKSGDLDMLNHLQGNVLVSAVMLLPYFWFASLCLCEMVAYYNWKHTRYGYRFRRRWIMLSSVVASVFFGSSLYALGMGERTDNLMVRSLPFYDQSKHSARREMWMQPERGLLMGKVVEMKEGQSLFIVRDELGNNWQIDGSALPPRPRPEIKRGRIVKVVGSKNDGLRIQAKEIRRCGDCGDDEEDEDK